MEMITHHSHGYRPLGLGLANLSALFMSMDMPHGSDRCRAIGLLDHGRDVRQAYPTRSNARLDPRTVRRPRQEREAVLRGDQGASLGHRGSEP